MKQTPNTVIQWFKQPYAAILSFIQRLQSRTNKISVTQATIIPRDEHPISRTIISRAALDVLYGLKDAGYEAYLVGGCLRDALNSATPKDCDVVTDAGPEEIHRTDRRARIIARRFRLVQLYFGRDVVEVATFR